MSWRRFVVQSVAILIAVAGFSLLFAPYRTARAAVGVNSQLSFQGKVVKADGTNIADGTYNVQFKIYQDGTSTGGGTLMWTESRLISTSTPVTFSSGTFSVNLGSVTPLSSVDFNQDTLWLSLQVGSTTSCTPASNFQANCGGDGEMTPYMRLTAAPQALNSSMLDGLTSSSFAQLSPAAQQTGAINVSGNISTAGSLNGAGLTVNGNVLLNSTGAVTLLSTDSTVMGVQIGSATTDATQIDFQLDSYNTYADSGTCSTTSNQGSMYYNTVTNAVRACINGAYEDLMSTGGLGLITFGVVPDSSNSANIGDLGNLIPASAPCATSWLSATSVKVAPCVAYSGGRKQIIASTTISTAGIAANAYVNICLTGANGQPALVGTGSSTETTAGLPAWSQNNPVLCLATLQMSTTAGTITGGKIYDIRTFTTTQKTFSTTNAARALGSVVVQSTTSNQVFSPTAAAAGSIRGVVIAYSGAGASLSANIILATAGPQWVKAVGTSTVNQYAQIGNTTGYTSSVTTLPTAGYATLGVDTDTIDTTCTSSSTCQYSQFLNPLSIR